MADRTVTRTIAATTSRAATIADLCLRSRSRTLVPVSLLLVLAVVSVVPELRLNPAFDSWVTTRPTEYAP